MTWTKIRSVLAAIFTIGLLFVVFCAISTKMGWQIPGVIQASRFMGIAQ